MLEIKPFKAFFPKENLGAKVSTRQIDSYTDNEIQTILKNNPLSFLNIIMGNINSDMKTAERFKLIKDSFEESINNGIFVQSKKESFYLYKQSHDSYSYCGIIAGASTKDYREDRIKKHEHTLEKREKVFTKYLRLTGFNAEPILLIHSEDNTLNIIKKDTLESKPIHSFLSNTGISHQLWEISEEETICKIQECYAKLDSLYIADGHHRSASSSLLALEDKNKESTQYVMALLMNENEITIHNFNRVIQNTTNKTTEEILDELKLNFDLLKQSEEIIAPDGKHHFTIYINNTWYLLNLKKKFNSNSSIVKQIDSQIITDYILSPIFDIQDLKNDTRVGFVPGNKGLLSLQDKVDKEKYDIAIAMYPVDVEEMKSISDNGLAMPPKSTFIEPKLRSGLTVYKFNYE